MIILRAGRRGLIGDITGPLFGAQGRPGLAHDGPLSRLRGRVHRNDQPTTLKGRAQQEWLILPGGSLPLPGRLRGPAEGGIEGRSAQGWSAPAERPSDKSCGLHVDDPETSFLETPQTRQSARRGDDSGRKGIILCISGSGSGYMNRPPIGRPVVSSPRKVLRGGGRAPVHGNRAGLVAGPGGGRCRKEKDDETRCRGAQGLQQTLRVPFRRVPGSLVQPPALPGELEVLQLRLHARELTPTASPRRRGEAGRTRNRNGGGRKGKAASRRFFSLSPGPGREEAPAGLTSARPFLTLAERCGDRPGSEPPLYRKHSCLKVVKKSCRRSWACRARNAPTAARK